MGDVARELALARDGLGDPLGAERPAPRPRRRSPGSRSARPAPRSRPGRAAATCRPSCRAGARAGAPAARRARSPRRVPPTPSAAISSHTLRTRSLDLGARLGGRDPRALRGARALGRACRGPARPGPRRSARRRAGPRRPCDRRGTSGASSARRDRPPRARRDRRPRRRPRRPRARGADAVGRARARLSTMPSGTPRISTAASAISAGRDDQAPAHAPQRSKRKPTPRIVTIRCGAGVVADLAPQPGHVHVEGLGRAEPVLVPDLRS